MISILNLIVYTSFIVFAIISGISTVFENVFAQEEVEQNQSSPLHPTLDNNNDDIIISEDKVSIIYFLLIILHLIF